MNTLKKLFGGVVALCSATLVAIALGDVLGGGGKNGLGVAVGLLIFFSGTMTAGVMMVRSAIRDARAPRGLNADQEVMLLQLARQNGGTLGAADVAARIRIPFADARRALDGLRKQGACVLVVTETGAELYRFPDLALSAGEAAVVKDLLDRS